MKLSAKFSRQENETSRLARIARKRITHDRKDTIGRMLDLPDIQSAIPEQHPTASVGATLTCPECRRTFKLPMHLGRHTTAKHLFGK